MSIHKKGHRLAAMTNSLSLLTLLLSPLFASGSQLVVPTGDPNQTF